MEELKKGVKVYGKNFFRLTLPFLGLFASSLPWARFLPPEQLVIQVLSGLGLAIIGLIFTSGAIVDTWGALENKKFGLTKCWSYVLSNLPKILLAVSVAIIPWLLLFYLFLNFFSFFLFAPLAIYPFFLVFTLPELLIGGSGTLEALRNSFRFSIAHSARTVLLTYLPMVLAILLTTKGLYSLTLLLVLPAWTVLISTNYSSLNRNAAPEQYFNNVTDIQDR